MNGDDCWQCFATLVRISFKYRLIVLRFKPVNFVICEALRSNVKYRKISLNFFSEILERFEYLFFIVITRTYITFLPSVLVMTQKLYRRPLNFCRASTTSIVRNFRL